MTSSGETSPLSITPSGTPLSNSAPKYGTLIPNRIFVGGIAANQNEQELKQFFSAYGAVKDCKIIADRAGVSKGYGFVTFETQEDAEKIIKKEADNLIFKDRKLNIGPAIRKQQAFPKLFEQSMAPGTVFFSNGVPYTYQNGMAVFQPSDTYAALSAQQTQQAAAAYPMMMQSAGSQPASAATMYALSQHAAGYPTTAYSSPTAAAAAAAGWGAQWRWAPQSPPVVSGNQYMTTAYPMQSPGSFPHDMMYTSQSAQYADMTTDSSMLEAAAQAAECGYGSQYGTAAPIC